MKDKIKNIKFIKDRYDKFRWSSISKAVKQQNLDDRMNKIMEYDVHDHYGTSKINTAYIHGKVKALHAFQTSLMGKLFENVKGISSKVNRIIDLGDSSGQHLQYTKDIFTLLDGLELSGMNIDLNAVEKIRKRGFNGIQGDLEYSNLNFNADYVYMFETLEHLNNPGIVLRKIKEEINPKALIITVPYVRQSRVGIDKTSIGKEDPNQEDIHIFELAPKCLKQMFTYTGWKIDYEQIYYQYSQTPIIKYFWRWYWKQFDYEGFVGYVLK